jgi:hypothetical protein
MHRVRVRGHDNRRRLTQHKRVRRGSLWTTSPSRRTGHQHRQLGATGGPGGPVYCPPPPRGLRRRVQVFLPGRGSAAAVGASPVCPPACRCRRGGGATWDWAGRGPLGLLSGFSRPGPRPAREAMGAPRGGLRPAGTRTSAAGSQRRCGCLPEGGARTHTCAAGRQRRCSCLPEGLGSRTGRSAPASAGPGDRSWSS